MYCEFEKASHVFIYKNKGYGWPVVLIITASYSYDFLSWDIIMVLWFEFTYLHVLLSFLAFGGAANLFKVYGLFLNFSGNYIIDVAWLCATSWSI